MSYMLKGGPMAAACGPHLDGKLVAVSFQSVAELWFGVAKQRWGERRVRALNDALRRLVVLPVDESSARIWGELKARAEIAGLSKQTADLWIAATAKRHDLPLLTNDRGFLAALDITVVRPEDPPNPAG